jgi:hypothetical protein
MSCYMPAMITYFFSNKIGNLVEKNAISESKVQVFSYFDREFCRPRHVNLPNQLDVRFF